MTMAIIVIRKREPTDFTALKAKYVITIRKADLALSFVLRMYLCKRRPRPIIMNIECYASRVIHVFKCESFSQVHDPSTDKIAYTLKFP